MSCQVRLVPYGIEIDVAYDGSNVSTRTFETGDEALAWATARRADRLSRGWREQPA